MSRIIFGAILILAGVLLAARQVATAGTQATNLSLTIETQNIFQPTSKLFRSPHAKRPPLRGASFKRDCR